MEGEGRTRSLYTSLELIRIKAVIWLIPRFSKMVFGWFKLSLADKIRPSATYYAYILSILHTLVVEC